MKDSFSVIIPAYNEQATIVKTVESLLSCLRGLGAIFEIIVVDDGSTDGTKEELKKLVDLEFLVLLSHPYNKGYGAALKTGISRSRYDWILTYDADGQHQPESISPLLAVENFDLIIGSRQINYKDPLVRRPGKKLLHWVAEYLSQKKIPDLNSGLRLARKAMLARYLHIFPNGFSFSTTSTIAAFKGGYNVVFVPVEVKPRSSGKSQVSFLDGFKTIMFVFRLIMIFSPLRIFLPLSGLLFLIGLLSLSYDLLQLNITDTTILFMLASLLIFLFGLLADQTASIRREIKL